MKYEYAKQHYELKYNLGYSEEYNSAETKDNDAP